MAQAFRGVYTIPVTPFDERGNLDKASLHREVDWCVRAGAHGIVAPVNASEGPTLTDDERRQVTRVVVEATAGRIPVVIGVSGVSVAASVFYAKYAREVGADAVIAMPPYGVRLADFPSVFAFYQAVAAAAGDLPVFVQNWSGPAGTPMTAPQVARLMREIPNVAYAKEETADASHLMTAIQAEAGDACRGIMGGIGGRHLLDEYRRGSCGTMPACQSTDIHAAIWNKLDAGDEASARALFYRLLPLLNMEATYGVALYKEVLRRRGVIASTTLRSRTTPALDDYDHRELDVLLGEVEDLFTV
ncbi:MAG TPA: dihydrodipicolinate synthase family protein [Thermomicrobiales bacterium]|nr:dihydrodipicolinate synthase family protein [Thermomicrobiales bacterium]